MSFYANRNKNNEKIQPEPLTLNEAKKKLMDFVARRDHTEKELRKKLSLHADSEIVEQTMSWAREQNWLRSPETLKDQLAEQLSRRGKGIVNINQKLNELGLDSVKGNFESELTKAIKLVSAKWSSRDFVGLDYKESQKLKAKVMRFLATRGYESSVISSVLKNNFKSAPNEEDIYDEEF